MPGKPCPARHPRTVRLVLGHHDSTLPVASSYTVPSRGDSTAGRWGEQCRQKGWTHGGGMGGGGGEAGQAQRHGAAWRASRVQQRGVRWGAGCAMGIKPGCLTRSGAPPASVGAAAGAALSPSARGPADPLSRRLTRCLALDGKDVCVGKRVLVRRGVGVGCVDLAVHLRSNTDGAGAAGGVTALSCALLRASWGSTPPLLQPLPLPLSPLPRPAMPPPKPAN